jgi:O-methyltransferase involved in polyketide biosynthesis
MDDDRPLTAQRDFSAISPSAKALLMVKAQTSLPFARQAAEVLWGASAVQEAERETASTPWAAGRRDHFEQRARSIDAAIEVVGSPRILELAAGLSFRGLDMAARRGDTFYLDTDLPEIASTKANLVARLHPTPLLGTLLVRPVDALEPNALRAAVDLMPPGPIAIVQEGLLMYLDDAEKTALATSVREVLLARGGAWVTADVYVRSGIRPNRDERTTKFLEQHRVEEKKFASFVAAASFFEAHGFAITRRLSPEHDPWPVRQTWVLEPSRTAR